MRYTIKISISISNDPIIKKILLVLSVITVFLFTIQDEVVAQGVTTYEQAIQKADKQFAVGHYMDAKGYKIRCKMG